MTDKNIKIRKATKADFPALMALQSEAVRKLSAGFYPEDIVEQTLAHVDLLTESVIEEGHYFVMIDASGAFLASGGWSQATPAYAHAMPGDYHEVAGSEAIVRSVYVRPDQARRGYGTRMMRMIERDAARAGISRLTLTATLPGVPLYRAMGYDEFGTSHADLPDGRRLELLEMGRDLEPSAARAA